MALWAISAIASFLVLIHTTSAQAFGPDNRWHQPDGSKPDFSSTYSVGDTITLSWQALNNSRSDLWLTHWDSTTYQWHSEVATDIDISVAGTLSWHIDVPASDVRTDNRFVLRFYPRGSPYTVLQFTQNASPGFYLTGGTTATTSVGGGGGATTSKSTSPSGQATTSSGTGGVGQTPTTTATTDPGASSSSSTISSDTLTSAPASTSSTPSTHPVSQSQILRSSSTITTVITTTNASGSTITTTVTTTTPLPTDVAGSNQSTSSSSSSSGLPIAAQIGIGVAAGVFIIILFIAGCFFGRRFGVGKIVRRNEYRTEGEDFTMQRNASAAFGNSDYGMAEMGGSKTSTTPQTSNTADSAALVSKRPGNANTGGDHDSRIPRVEVKGSNSYAVEKGGVMIKPGVHEIE